MDQGCTVGVEEDFLLVDNDGYPLARCNEVLALLQSTGRNVESADFGARFKPDMQPVQIDAVSRKHTTMEALGTDLRGTRDALAAATKACGVVALPTGTAPLRTDGLAPAPALGRNARIRHRYGDMSREFDAAGCRVHIGVDDPDLAVAVVNHLRPWLPTLIAAGSNSPFHDGHDSGYSSWRIAAKARFPGSGLPPYARSADEFESRVATLVECGVLVDDRMTFWLARPSAEFPTVEVRAADSAATVGDAMLQAVLTRGLVRTAIRKLSEGVEGPRIDEHVGAAAVWTAAKYGLTGPAVDPIEEVRVPATHMLSMLVARIADELEELGDIPLTRQLLAMLESQGTGAVRQRAAARPGLRDLVAAFKLKDNGIGQSRSARSQTAESQTMKETA